MSGARSAERCAGAGRRSAVPPAMMVLFAVLLVGAAPQEDSRVRYVIDGDTFVLESGERIRIADIDAPETRPWQARCRAEIALGERATRQARTLLEGRRVGIERVGRSYNRTVARVSIDGRDVATALVKHGAARRWPRGAPRPDWCTARPG